MITVSVVVCTLNRAPSLQRTLASLREQTAAADVYEVLVVDNGCTDRTGEVVAEALVRSSNVRCLREPQLGLSHARNRGIADALGDVVAFIDDDAEASPGWVQALAGEFDDTTVGAVGGKVRLVFPTGRPSWLPPRLEGHYSGLDLGDEPRDFPAPKGPFGTNMAIRRALLRDVGGFATDLGRKGRSLMSSEEVELFARVRAAGSTVRYEPAAVVHHHVELERMSPRYLVRRAFAQGRSRARQHDHVRPGADARTWARRSAAAAWAGTRLGVTGTARALRVRDETAAELVSEACRFASRIGFAAEAARLATSRRRNRPPPALPSTDA